MQDAIKQLKLKDYIDNKESIGNKIKSLEENIKLIESMEAGGYKNDITINNQSIIDENIRKSRVKEIKNTKDVLENKLFSLENQIKLLMAEEYEKDKKKLNIKSFLDNFEKDKKDSELRSKEFERKREERIKYLKEIQLKAELKVKEKYEMIESDKKDREVRKREEYEQNLVKMRQRSIDFLEEKIKQREDWRQSQKELEARQYTYAHHKLEDFFNQKEKKHQEEQGLKHEEETYKRKQALKPIKHEEIDAFQNKYLENKKKLIYEKERERIIKLETIRNNAQQDPKPTSIMYYRVLEDEKHQKEDQEKKKIEKSLISAKRGNFSNHLREHITPKVSQGKKKELEDMVFKLKTSKIIKKKTYDRSKIVLLKKHDPSKPYRYSWKINLTLEDSQEKDVRKRPQSQYSRTASFDKENTLNRPLSGFNTSKHLSVEKRVPLQKNPDYLTENRIKNSHNRLSQSMNKSNYCFNKR